MYAASPSQALPAFRKLSAAQAQALLEKLDRWLAEHDIDAACHGPDCRARASASASTTSRNASNRPSTQEPPA